MGYTRELLEFYSDTYLPEDSRAAFREKVLGVLRPEPNIGHGNIFVGAELERVMADFPEGANILEDINRRVKAIVKLHPEWSVSSAAGEDPTESAEWLEAWETHINGPATEN